MKFFYTNFLFTTSFNLGLMGVSANNTLRGSMSSSGGNHHPSIHRFLEEDEASGTFVVAVIEYTDRGLYPNMPKETMNIELENGLIYELVNVDPSWINGKGKSLESGRSKIKVGKGALLVGDKIDLQGRAPEEVQSLFDRNLGGLNNRKLASTTGTRSVLAVRVIASDGQYGFDEATLSDDVFGTFGDPVNLVSQYKACSFDQLNFVPAEDPQISSGVVTISVDTSITEGDDAVRNAVTSAINAKFGVSSPNQIADHVMYCLPPETMSGIAYAYKNSWNSVYSNQWCNYVSSQMHEIGHNLNFGHSNELGTYEDKSGMMGYSYSSDDSPVMCFNSAKSFQAGWYPTKTITPASADCGDSDGRVYGLSDFGIAGEQGTIVVKINNSQSSQVDYFLNYNKKAGVNSGTLEGGNQVMITSRESENTAYSSSELLAKLSIGGTYTIANFEGTGNDVTITFESMDTSVSPNPARVVVSYNGMVCGSDVTASPTTTLAPITPSPSKAPVTSPPTPEPCWVKGEQCDPNGAHKCCNGCQASGRNAGTCK